MPDGFEVEEGVIAELAQAFDHESDRLNPILAGFQAAAYSVHDAFGPWGVSHEMLQEYLETADEALQGLHHVQRALASDAGRLRAAEANYLSADSASTHRR